MASSSRPSQPVSDETLGRWRERLAGLRAALGQAPGVVSAEQGWVWRLQFAIFAYLLKRYAREVVPPPLPAHGAGRRGPPPLPPALPEADPAAAATVLQSRSSSLLPKRSFDKIRGRLSSLVAENRERVEAIAAQQAAERARQRALDDRERHVRADWADALFHQFLEEMAKDALPIRGPTRPRRSGQSHSTRASGLAAKSC